jgi:hypothetical protein
MVRPDARLARQAGQATGRSDPPSQRQRHDGLSDTAACRDQGLTSATSESWVEVSSQPSSSSLSSIGDDIVTTGLRVGSNTHALRRRRLQQQPMPGSFIIGHPATQRGATSSQEEYDETESEEDRVMTSSTEAIHPSANGHRQRTTLRAAMMDVASDSDDDENATALGRPSNSPVFNPGPNAFSHPPSHLTHRHSTGSAPHYHHHIPHSRPLGRSQRGTQDIMSPSYQADHDAALRASLTTLLSCAAAARSLPKHEERRNAPRTGAGIVPSSQPMELRLVPESELMADDSPPTVGPSAAGPSSKVPRQQAATTRTASNSSSPSAPYSPPGREREAGRPKREAATQSRPARATKKKRTSGTILAEGETAAADADASLFSISPTIFTWVVSAGVVVLVSVVGFGAGYVIGREVGRQESATAALTGFGPGGGANASSAAASCGSELARSGGTGTLRRFQWGGVGKSVTA